MLHLCLIEAETWSLCVPVAITHKLLFMQEGVLGLTYIMREAGDLLRQILHNVE